MSSKVWKDIYESARSQGRAPDKLVGDSLLVKDIEKARMETRIFVARLMESRLAVPSGCREIKRK